MNVVGGSETDDVRRDFLIVSLLKIGTVFLTCKKLAGVVYSLSDSVQAGRSADRISGRRGGGRDFAHPSRPALRPALSPVQWVLGLFPVGEAAGGWV